MVEAMYYFKTEGKLHYSFTKTASLKIAGNRKEA